MQVEAGAAGHVVLAGVAVILDAAGRIQHKHVGERRLLTVVGVGHRASVGVQLLVQAGAGVVVQLLAVGFRERHGQAHAAAVLGGNLLPRAKTEQRGVAALQRRAVAGRTAADQLAGGVPAVFLAVACVLTALVKGKRRLADMVAVQILIRQRVEQVCRVDVLVNRDRHRVQRQRGLQKQVAARTDRPHLADAVHVGKQRHKAGGVALGHALDQHIGGRNAPLGLCAVQRAQHHGHGALAGVVGVVQPGQRVGTQAHRGLGRRLGSDPRGGGRCLLRRGGHGILPGAAAQQQGSQQRRSAAPCLQFPHIQYLSVNKQRGPPPGEPRCTGRFNYSAGVSSAGVSSAGASVFSAGAPSSAGVFS